MATQPQPDGVLAQLPEVASETLQMAQAATASTFTFADRSGKQITKRPKDFTDDDLQVINGKREQLEGKIQERYGYGRDQVKKELDDWSSSL